MEVLVIGGNRFVGQLLVERLLARGDSVTLLNRGNREDPFGARVKRLRADRTTDAFDQALAGHTFDATVDFAAFKALDLERLVRVLGPRAGHTIFISTGQVYLVCPRARRPAPEEDYDLPVMPEPDKTSADWKEWDYGIGKRACEDVLLRAAASGFVSTRLRIPMVNGPNDYYRRLESYAWRILDGGPVLIAEGRGADTRHIWGDDVARTIAQILGDARVHGRAFNVSQAESLPLRTLLERFGRALGKPANVREVSVAKLQHAGLVPEIISPFSQRWMSCLDPSRAQRELHFKPTAFEEYVDGLAAVVRAKHKGTPPDSYGSRATELALASTLE
jgi:nucleoside-diphosphate-sugar epimerase